MGLHTSPLQEPQGALTGKGLQVGKRRPRGETPKAFSRAASQGSLDPTWTDAFLSLPPALLRQDPKYPVDNLLLEEEPQPWLCCPSDRSRQLKAELQLEHASCIGYIDVGNCGSAFLQIDVGRSSWPPDQSYLTLLPTTTLMGPADAKLNKNRSGVRMFKEGDLLASAMAEKWDRVRLICSQPFNRHTQFGLFFLRIRTPRDTEDSQADPAASSPCQASPESQAKPWPSRAAFGGTFFPAGPSPSTEEETLLKSQLHRLDQASHHKGLSPPCLSRPARLVLEAAASVRKRAPLLPTGSPPPAARSRKAGRAQRAAERPSAPGPKQEQSARSSRMKTKRRPGSHSSRGRPRNSSRRVGRAHGQRGKPRTREDGEEEEEEEESMSGEGDAALGTCPICAGRFPAQVLPVHASGCGEEVGTARASSSPLWEAWVDCPICQVSFPASEVEGHASSCGEDA
ncbi:short transient receptor potential channel 2-like [Python bivittatus]|uniref:Short transient receptor potential channel 2-like n=1 Tax=Python bivittatus TaxID=176946 RepID=A0A9F3QV84_PYTBI|nr:short transient receptor potential channel 2-like [Python bivittatus]